MNNKYGAYQNATFQFVKYLFLYLISGFLVTKEPIKFFKFIKTSGIAVLLKTAAVNKRIIVIFILSCYFSCKVGVLAAAHLFVPKALSYRWFLPAAHNRRAARFPAFFNCHRLLVVPFIRRRTSLNFNFAFLHLLLETKKGKKRNGNGLFCSM